jgi:hypothetical protein
MTPTQTPALKTPSIARQPSAHAIAATRVANNTARDVLNVSIAPPQLEGATIGPALPHDQLEKMEGGTAEIAFITEDAFGCWQDVS